MTSLLGFRRLLQRRRAAFGGDGGFSLLEAVVALVIAGGVFSSLSVALLKTVRASVTARQSQSAADLLNQQVEYIRSLDFSKVTHIKSDLAGDPNLTYTAATDTYTLNTSAGAETVAAGSVGLITQHIKTVTQQNTTYTLSTYVTTVNDTTNASANYRRVTVIAQWTTNGRVSTRRTSSFFTDTRRGLPLPRFTIGTAGTYKTNVGATLALPVKITNVGAPDAFNLTATAPLSGSWAWYYDSNGDGVYTSADSLLSDSDGNGQKDTGILQVGSSILVFAVRTVNAGEDSTQTVTIQATSAAQPTAATATGGFSDQVLVNPASCTGCTLTTYYLHNSSTYGNTVFQSSSGSNTPMYMDKTAPAATRLNLFNYSTDCSTLVGGATDCGTVPYGRYVAIGGTQTESDRTKVAAWYYSVPSATTLAGTAAITIWVQPTDGSGAAGTITAYVGSDTNNSISGGNFSPAGSKTITVPATSPAAWQPITIGIPLTGTLSINQNKYLGVRVTASGTLNLRVAYDTTTYNAQAVLPIVSGG